MTEVTAGPALPARAWPGRALCGCVSGPAAATRFPGPAGAGFACSAVMPARVVSIMPPGQPPAGSRCHRSRPVTRSARWRH